MIQQIALTEIETELAAVADRLRRITVKVYNGNLGVGAGTIWQPDGVIITNAHVATSDRLTVALADGRLFPAQRTHFAPEQDLAATMIVNGLAVAIPIHQVAELLLDRDSHPPGGVR